MSKCTNLKTWNGVCVVGSGGNVICKCDNCNQEKRVEFNTYPNYKEVQQELRSMGWVSKKIDGEWKDFCCQECADEYY